MSCLLWPLQTGAGTKKRKKECVIIHTISSRCKKDPRPSQAGAHPPPPKKIYLSPGGVTAQEEYRPLTHGGHNYCTLKLCLSTHAGRKRMVVQVLHFLHQCWPHTRPVSKGVPQIMLNILIAHARKPCSRREVCKNSLKTVQKLSLE